TILGFGSLIATDGPRHDTVKEVSRVFVESMPPEGYVFLFKARAVGTQIYVCKAEADDPDRFECVLKAPEADLFDEGREAGRSAGTSPVRRWRRSKTAATWLAR